MKLFYGISPFLHTRQGSWAQSRLLCVARIAAWTPALFLVGAYNLHSQESGHPEYEVKAAYLYNFGRFVGWPSKPPSDEAGSFAICVLGHDPFGTTLDATLAGEAIDGKSVVLRRISKPQDTSNCRILFISASEGSQLKEILARLDKMSVLTVSDIPQFTRRGGMVQFILEENKVRFEINLAAAERAGLSLSSQLLKVAANVARNPQPAD